GQGQALDFSREILVDEVLQRGPQLRPSVREPMDLGERPGYVWAGLGERRIERRCRTHQRHRGSDHVPWLEEAQILAMPMDAYPTAYRDTARRHRLPLPHQRVARGGVMPGAHHHESDEVAGRER